MATSAFKSNTKRMPMGSSPSSAASSTNRRPEAHRRSRSLSRFSRWNYTEEEGETPATRGMFPEATLDDTFFGSAGGDRGRSGSRGDLSNGSAWQRRGRSVSRQGANWKGTSGNSYKNERTDSEIGNSSRRRSVSVVRYRMSDSESDLDHPHTSSNHARSRGSMEGNRHALASDNKTAYANPRPGLKRSLSQKDLRQHGCYSSHSSVLTDDEGRDAYCDKNGPERTIRAVYAQTKHPTGNDNGGLYEVMRKELRHAVDEIRMELEQSTVGKRIMSGLTSDDYFDSKGSDVMRVVKSYASKLVESEKRKHDLLAEMVLEEQHGQEISRIVKELLPDTQNVGKEKPLLRTRKRSNDRNRMSKRLTEEAEKYIEDFLSSIEDTDISSLDGERSETSSTFGSTLKNETFQSPPLLKSLPVEMDGVVLPWLQWETATDASPQPYSNKMVASPLEPSNQAAASGRGSWSPEAAVDRSATAGKVTGSRAGSSHRQVGSTGTESSFDAQEYLSRRSEEEFLLERWRNEARICSGSLLLYSQMTFIM